MTRSLFGRINFLFKNNNSCQFSDLTIVKSDEDLHYKEAYRYSLECRNAYLKFRRWFISFMLLSAFMSATTGTIAVEVDWYIGLTYGFGAAWFIAIPIMFNWSTLSEKYASLAIRFNRLTVKFSQETFDKLKAEYDEYLLDSDFIR